MLATLLLSRSQGFSSTIEVSAPLCPLFSLDCNPKPSPPRCHHSLDYRMDIAQFQPVDRISNLPDNVIDSILMHLTLRDAAKSSILSKQWRYKWVKLPQLRFDVTIWQEYEGNLESARMKFLLILYKILLLHLGPITKLRLVIPKLKNCSEIDNLIHILWKNSVEEFTFKIKSGEQ